MFNLLVFVIFSISLFLWSKNFYNLFVLKFTNINNNFSQEIILNDLKNDSLKFGIFLYFIITLLGKTSFILSFLFFSCLCIFLILKLREK